MCGRGGRNGMPGIKKVYGWEHGSFVFCLRKGREGGKEDGQVEKKGEVWIMHILWIYYKGEKTDI